MHLHASLHVWSCTYLALSHTPYYRHDQLVQQKNNTTMSRRIAQQLVGNGFSFILNFRLPDVQLVIGWSVAEVGCQVRWFTFFRRSHAPSPWNRFRATWYFYICLLNVYWFSHWPSLTTCTLMSFGNRFVFTIWFFQFLPKTKNTCYSGACGACTFGRMQIGWILHKVCSFVGTGRAFHQSRYSSYASFLAGSVGSPFSKHSWVVFLLTNKCP